MDWRKSWSLQHLIHKLQVLPPGIAAWSSFPFLPTGTATAHVLAVGDLASPPAKKSRAIMLNVGLIQRSVLRVALSSSCPALRVVLLGLHYKPLLPAVWPLISAELWPSPVFLRLHCKRMNWRSFSINCTYRGGAAALGTRISKVPNSLWKLVECRHWHIKVFGHIKTQENIIFTSQSLVYESCGKQSELGT